jgi:hypothetical protein
MTGRSRLPVMRRSGAQEPPPAVEKLSGWSDLDFEQIHYDYAHLGIGSLGSRGAPPVTSAPQLVELETTDGGARREASSTTPDWTLDHLHPGWRTGDAQRLRSRRARRQIPHAPQPAMRSPNTERKPCQASGREQSA